MVEQYNPIGAGGLMGPGKGLSPVQTTQKIDDGSDFKSLLMKSINEVNRLQNEADQATVNLATGKTDNIAEVFTAINKADIAFRTLMEIRNKLMSAYEEVNQMRV